MLIKTIMILMLCSLIGAIAGMIDENHMAHAKYYNNNPTESKVYFVKNCEDLNNIRNDMSGTYILMNDIDCGDFK